MATLLEQALAIHTPVIKEALSLSSDDSAPTVVTDGVDITGFQVGAYSVSAMSGVTGYDYEVYVWTGNYWKVRASGSTLTAVTDFQVHLAGYFRSSFRIFNIVGIGTLHKQLNVSI